MLGLARLRTAGVMRAAASLRGKSGTQWELQSGRINFNNFANV